MFMYVHLHLHLHLRLHAHMHMHCGFQLWYDFMKIYVSFLIQCFFPQYFLEDIYTPTFILESAYDTYQV